MSPRASLPLLTGFLCLVLLGCGSRPDPSASFAGIRVLTLASLSGLSSTELPSILSDELGASLRRSLAVRGYEVREASGGDGEVRASWFQQSQLQPGGRGEILLGISVSLFDRSGARILSVRSKRLVPANQWNGDRVAAEVSSLLRDLPEADRR